MEPNHHTSLLIDDHCQELQVTVVVVSFRRAISLSAHLSDNSIEDDFAGSSCGRSCEHFDIDRFKSVENMRSQYTLIYQQRRYSLASPAVGSLKQQKTYV